MKNTLEIKTTKLTKQNTCEKKKKKNTIPESLILAKERHTIKENLIQKMEKFGTRPKIRTTDNRPCRFCGAPNWTPLHKCPASEIHCNKCGSKRHYVKVCRQKYTNNRTVKKLTEEETDDRDETSSDSEESLHQIRGIKNRREEKTLLSNSENKRKEERIYNRHRITENDNATGKIGTRKNRDTENHKQISRRKQERSKLPGKNSGRYGIRKQQTENGHLDNRKNRHNTTARDGLDEKIQTNNRKNTIDRKQPIRRQDSVR